jgi:hypothetical protein
MLTPHNANCRIPCTIPGHSDHVHIKIDQYGYCEDPACGARVMTHFAGYRLPDRPNDPPASNHAGR